MYPLHRSPDQALTEDRFESVALGKSLALHGSFSSPFFPILTGPSAHLAPAYPALVAVVIKLFGTGQNGGFVLRWLTKLALASQLALLPALADYLGLSSMAGALAAVAWLAAQFPLLLWENDFAGLLVIALAFPMYRALREQLNGKAILYTGLVWGLLLLLTPTPLFVLCGWILALLFLSPQSKQRAIMLATVPLLVILPWLVRNYVVFHEPIFLRDNLGLELAVSNNSCAEYSWALNLRPGGCFSRNHPNENLQEALRVSSMGEPAYNKTRLHEALTWIGRNPDRFLTLTEERFIAFWSPRMMANSQDAAGELGVNWILDAFTLLSVPGLFLVWRRNRYAAVLMGLWLACFPPIYYLIQFDPRYRHPILWATFLPGAFTVTSAVTAIASKSLGWRRPAGLSNN